MRAFVFGFLLLPCLVWAQSAERWQQAAKYDIDIDFDVKKNQFDGKQVLEYTNNSPDTLTRAFYYLFFNAFQPGSAMDIRSQTIMDADPRVGSRIGALKPDEYGYQKINKLTQNGKPVTYEVSETILEVQLAEPILPGETAVFEMEFEAQVPIQIRRSGRDSEEGVEYSMTQWFPKMCEYDYQGWHAHPYIGREFHGVWSDMNVNITIDKDYLIGGTGYLTNADKIGGGYDGSDQDLKRRLFKRNRTWKFEAPNVIDFAWAADPDYIHTTKTRNDGTVLHFLYQPSEEFQENWEQLPDIMDYALDYIEKMYGDYPYKQYTIIQGGDGGMEYPMATLITGERPLASLVGVSVHELMHSWFQGVLATNEALYPWMDEGFTSFATSEVMNYLRENGKIPGEATDRPHAGSYSGYARVVESGYEEPLSTHGDHYATNFGYGIASYAKGAVFLAQLEYVLGENDFHQGMLRYFDTWKFKHPNPNDFIRVMEKQSGLELDWYREYMVNSIRTIDYGIDSVFTNANQETTVQLSRAGEFIMPVDVVVTYSDRSQDKFTIPLDIMRGAKNDASFTVLPDWVWVKPNYEFSIDTKGKTVASVAIDPSDRLADLNKENNKIELGGN